MNYDKAVKLLDTARNPAKGKPVDRNTRLFRRSPTTIALRLYNTDIVTYHSNGDVTLNTGGWLTVTTKQRMNNYAPVRIYSHRGVWYVGNDDTLYADGMIICADGTIKGAGKPSEREANKKVMKEAKAYAKGFVDKLYNCEIGLPSNGDCWGCHMRTNDGKAAFGSGHILEHFEEKYYVPSLLVNALNEIPSSIAAKGTAQAYMQKMPERAFTSERGDLIAKQIEKNIYQYVLRQLGLG